MSRRAAAVQVLRKLIQLSALGFLVYAAMSAHWRNFKVAHNSDRLVGLMTNDVYAALYRMNETLLSWFGDPLAVSDGFLGAPWSATVAGVPLADPFSVAAVLVSGEVPPGTTLLAALVPLGLALALGKVFCSFLCPARLLFELSGAVRQGLIHLGLDLPSVSIPRLGLWVGLGALFAAASAGAGVFHFVLPYLALSSAITVGLLGGGLSAAGVAFGVILAVDALVAPGQICRSLCPTGAVLGLVGRRAPLRLTKAPDSATVRACPTSCDLCQRACPYGLFPGRETHVKAGCDSCGRCALVCPESKLSHRLKVGAAAALIGLGLLAAPAAQAHHNKGLPHYGYFDNYPQVPTEDYIRVAGKWEFGGVLFNFQGLARETSDTPNDVKFFLYAYDLDADATWRGPITFEIQQDGVVVSAFDRVEPDSEGVYVTRETLPSSGNYDVVFHFAEDGQPVTLVLPIYADLAADRIDWGLLGGVGAGVGVIFVLALSGRRRRHARRAPAAS